MGVTSEKVRAVLRVVTQIQRRYVNGDPATKKRVVLDIGSNLKLTDRIFSMQAKIPFRIIAEFLEDAATGLEPFEPEKYTVGIGRIGKSTHAIPSGRDGGPLIEPCRCRQVYQPLGKRLSERRLESLIRIRCVSS
jgi:hypothetical protein